MLAPLGSPCSRSQDYPVFCKLFGASPPLGSLVLRSTSAPQPALSQDRREFLTVYGDDALFIANTFNRTTATVRYLGEGEGGLASQTVSTRLLPSMLRRLVTELGYSFEIWAQLGGKGSQWSVVRKGSPGNFEDDAGQDEQAQGAPFMTALQLGSAAGGALAVGLAFVDQLGLVVGEAVF
jgi:DNA mismatch repair protein MSH2